MEYWPINFKKQVFRPIILLLNLGLGLLLDKNYEEARKKLTEAGTVASADPVHIHQSAYYIGWTYFLEADNNKAKEFFRQSQDIAKQYKIDEADWLTYPYANFPVAGSFGCI